MACLFGCAPDLLMRAQAELKSGATGESKALLQRILDSYQAAAKLLSRSPRAREARLTVYRLCEEALRIHFFGGVALPAACRHAGLDKFIELGPSQIVVKIHSS